MAITRLNHAVLYVRDAQRTADFYTKVLGFRRVAIGPEGWTGAVFLQAPGSTNDHDLGVFSIGDDASPSPAGRGGAVGLYHLAWEVETLDDLARLANELDERGALVGSSDHGTTKSLYARDPDGLEFEVAWIVPADQLDDAAMAGRSTIGPLDIDRERRRYGASTRGGIGISTPAR
jgi:catechol 2,3-dioxygenase-like lactoylglutathione lyase family enzyme